MEPSTITNAASSWGCRWVRWTVVAIGLALVVYAIAARTGRWLGAPCWAPARTASTRNTPGADEEARFVEKLGSAGIAAVGSAIAFAGWPRRERRRPRFDARRLLCLPCYEAAFGIAASFSADWGSVLRRQAGVLHWVARGATSADLVVAIFVVGAVGGLTTWSVLSPSFRWIPALVIAYLAWMGLERPIVVGP